ncbi:hypothetical protein LEP1GSC035_2411 [Leptospira noguchii str. 2007001578]|uniref:Uncharacterized protein n=1 Tax=Leptospira noguchii str. 2007001578 TaxID=1049974 RepID=A0ABN0J3N9_9LEPT|nr:hypothetical protein LEP1GSC035_2411 [Leptospira noguchii str. 2007001578]
MRWPRQSFNPLPSQTKEEIFSDRDHHPSFWSFNPLPSQTKEEIAAIKALIDVLEKVLLTFLDIIIANLMEPYYINAKQNLQIDKQR